MLATIAEEAAQQAETASLICKATVTPVDASNEPSVPPDPGLVVARVDAVFKASPDLGDLAGQEIIIQDASASVAPRSGSSDLLTRPTGLVAGRSRSAKLPATRRRQCCNLFSARC